MAKLAGSVMAVKLRDLRILEELHFLARCHCRRAGTRHLYSWPARKYLAARAGCSVRSVTRALGRLTAAGAVRRVQRRAEQGTWRSNLYTFSRWAARGAARLITRGLRWLTVEHTPPRAIPGPLAPSKKGYSGPRSKGAAPPPPTAR